MLSRLKDVSKDQFLTIVGRQLEHENVAMPPVPVSNVGELLLFLDPYYKLQGMTKLAIGMIFRENGYDESGWWDVDPIEFIELVMDIVKESEGEIRDDIIETLVHVKRFVYENVVYEPQE